MDDLRQHLHSRGATLVGFGELTALPSEHREGFPRCVSIGLALDPSTIAEIHDGPTQAYVDEYLGANLRLQELGEAAEEWLLERSHRAKALTPTDIPELHLPRLATLPHKTAATRCGLGWIGRTGLLVTEECGSALRITTVLTDAPLRAAEPIDESRCGDCARCAEACPGSAASGDVWSAAADQEALIDRMACRRVAHEWARKLGTPHTVCGICAAACPWTEKYVERALGS